MSPTIAISLDPSSLKVDFKLSENSPDFSLSSVKVSGGTLKFFGGFGDSFSAFFSPTANSTSNGIITVESGAFTNALGNKNADGSDANNTVVIPPAKTTTTTPVNVVTPKNSSPPTIEISFDAYNQKVNFKLSEFSPDFSLNSVNVSGGTLKFFGGFGESFAAYFSPTTPNSALDIKVPVGAFKNAAGIANAIEATTNDTTRPTIELKLSANSPRIDFKLSEYSPNFNLDAITVTGGTLKYFGGFGDTFSALFIPTANSKTDGIVTVKSATFMDTFGNRNADGLDSNNTVVIPVNKSGVVTNLIAIQPSSLTVQTTAANDLIEGSVGTNSVLYSGLASSYKVADSTNGITTIIDSVTNRSGTDTLINVERIKFSLPEPTVGVNSIALDIAPTDNAGSVYMLYKAAFNRAPDAGGMGYWLAAKDSGKDIVTSLAQGFVVSEEFTEKYGTNPSNSAYVDKLYQNVLGRAGEVGGVAYWKQELDAGRISKAAVLVQFATLAEGAANVASLIANGIPYAEYVG
jgi:hypothetical protein